jgi:hypothetical protein
MTSTTRRWFATLLSLTLVGGLILVTPVLSLGQEKHKISWSAKAEDAKYLFLHRLDIPDISEHRPLCQR